MRKYTGTVDVGGPAQRRDVPGAVITKVAVGPMDNNAYLVECAATGTRCLIDAAADPETLLRLLQDRGLDHVVTTHSHRDHWGALARVVAQTRARTAAGRLDAPGIAVPTDRMLDDGDVVEVGDVRLHVVHLAGHTPGSVALVLDLRTAPDGAAAAAAGPEAGTPVPPVHVFTGDSLFPGGLGRTIEETFDSLFHDVTTKLFDRFPDGTWVYPGHGADTTLGAERPQLAQWQHRRW